MIKNVGIVILMILILVQNFLLSTVVDDVKDMKQMAIERGVASYNDTSGEFEWTRVD